MYKNVRVFDNDNGGYVDYTVTDTENRVNRFQDSKGRTFEWSKPTVDVWYPCGKRKPSIYKRPFPFWTRDEYDYLYTNVTDVYYNERRNRFLGRTYTYSY